MTITPGSTRPVLSESQFDTLRDYGAERTAAVGDVLYSVGDPTYPLIAILEGEAAVFDVAGNEIIRHATGGFLGEMNLLTGQTVYLTAIVTEPLRYIEVERHRMRDVIADNEALADTLIGAFIARREALQGVDGVGVELIGPWSANETRSLVEWVRRARLPYSYRDTDRDEGALETITTLRQDGESLPLVRLPGGQDMWAPTPGQLFRALGIGLELAKRETVDLLIVGAGPGGLGSAVYGASEGLNSLVIEATYLGGQAGTSRRIENYLGFPAGISGAELTTRAISQARKFGARTATPYRAIALEPGSDTHVVRLEDDHCVEARAVILATGAQYRRLPVDNLDEFEGASVFYAAGPPEAKLCGGTHVGVVGGGNSAAQAAVWLARGGAHVTLLHRRANIAETMSDYLIHELVRYGVTVRDRSEIVQLHGEGGQLQSVTLSDGAELVLRFLFLFLGASPCTEWLGDTVARDEHGFVVTGEAAGADGLLETSIPGVFAVGDVRSGSVKRCATAVGEGAMAVAYVHEWMSSVPA
ncbi:MAG TPA: FAD-dependent oxidoreductase [Solirubrobacteraceae bacterium]|nr:FAD-dependent oxidoreductase [Solirubrobacteraceae bacterium]